MCPLLRGVQRCRRCCTSAPCWTLQSVPSSSPADTAHACRASPERRSFFSRSMPTANGERRRRTARRDMVSTDQRIFVLFYVPSESIRLSAFAVGALRDIGRHGRTAKTSYASNWLRSVTQYSTGRRYWQFPSMVLVSFAVNRSHKKGRHVAVAANDKRTRFAPAIDGRLTLYRKGRFPTQVPTFRHAQKTIRWLITLQK